MPMYEQESEPSSLCMRDEACSTLSEIKLNFQTSLCCSMTSKDTPTSHANWSEAFTSTTQSPRLPERITNFNARLCEPILTSHRRMMTQKENVEKKDFSVGTDDHETCSFNLTDSVYTSKFENSLIEDSKDAIASEHTTPLKSSQF